MHQKKILSESGFDRLNQRRRMASTKNVRILLLWWPLSVFGESYSFHFSMMMMIYLSQWYNCSCYTTIGSLVQLQYSYDL